MTCLLVTHEIGSAREVANHIYFTDHRVGVRSGETGSGSVGRAYRRTR